MCGGDSQTISKGRFYQRQYDFQSTYIWKAFNWPILLILCHKHVPLGDNLSNYQLDVNKTNFQSSF